VRWKVQQLVLGWNWDNAGCFLGRAGWVAEGCCELFSVGVRVVVKAQVHNNVASGCGLRARGVHTARCHLNTIHISFGWCIVAMLLTLWRSAPGGCLSALRRPLGAVFFGYILFCGAAPHGHAWAPLQAHSTPLLAP
jgi:hypothetical protein